MYCPVALSRSMPPPLISERTMRAFAWRPSGVRAGMPSSLSMTC